MQMSERFQKMIVLIAKMDSAPIKTIFLTLKLEFKVKKLRS